ncbi:MAG: HAMP domain-containing histidine kinase [Chloroflexi bacterium]|nr:HAMP domain-containing histidine kinase [Chloroflexota bacterium]
MNRLWVRLTAAFVAVTLVSVGTVALLAGWNASDQFRQYVYHQDELAQNDLADELAAPAGQRLGSTVDLRSRGGGAPVTVEGRLVGYVTASDNPRDFTAPPEQNFLDQLRVTLVIAAVVAGSLGILFGTLISRTLAAPLADLASTARAFAARDWGRRVSVRGAAQTAEIAAVARAFNEMADDLQHAETLRRNLMADVAHELRTPLSVLQGNLRALLDDVYPLERREIATLYDQTRLLSRLVDDLHQLALAESGQLPLNVQAIDLMGLLQATHSQFAAGAEAQGLSLTVGAGLAPALAPALPRARADADRLAQVLQNLISNAIRHTPTGGRITITAEPLAIAAGEMVRVSVGDTGDGIAPEDLPHVFDRFYRADRSRSHRGGGAGLGLAIAKSLTEAMGGTIGVESARGQGSRFWFTLPVAGA